MHNIQFLNSRGARTCFGSLRIAGIYQSMHKQVGCAAVWHVFGTTVNIGFSLHGFTHVQLYKKSPSAAHSQQMAVFTTRGTCPQISCDQWLFSKHRLCCSIGCSICSVDQDRKPIHILAVQQYNGTAYRKKIIILYYIVSSKKANLSPSSSKKLVLVVLSWHLHNERETQYITMLVTWLLR